MSALMRCLLPASLLSAALAVGIAMRPAGGAPAGGATPANDAQTIVKRMGMRNINVHDPSTIVQCKDEYYVYATGMPMFHSKDLITWTRGPTPITQGLSWTESAIGPRGRNAQPGAYWAPDVIHVKDKYFLFVSISGFGVNTSGIGVLSSPTLDPNDPACKWTDNGLVVKSETRDDFNCIDPAALYDTDGRLWLSFGSFWSGIKLIELNPDTGARIAPDSPMYSIAHWDSIEASYIYKHDGHYFLFVDLGMCCRGARSTYNMRIGRSDKITGPYLDKDGKDMLLGGGSPLMDSHIGPLIGPGHAGIVQVGDKFFISCHMESNATGGGTLSVRPLTWDPQGWPTPGDAD
jgi:arabinan endo-1,5-alpha-L-arabinosidase